MLNQKIEPFIKQRESSISAFNALNKQLYGEGHPSSIPLGGTTESVESITLDDLKEYFEQNIPKVAHFHIVGDINQNEFKSLKIIQ